MNFTLHNVYNKPNRCNVTLALDPGKVNSWITNGGHDNFGILIRANGGSLSIPTLFTNSSYFQKGPIGPSLSLTYGSTPGTCVYIAALLNLISSLLPSLPFAEPTLAPSVQPSCKPSQHQYLYCYLTSLMLQLHYYSNAHPSHELRLTDAVYCLFFLELDDCFLSSNCPANLNNTNSRYVLVLFTFPHPYIL